MSRPVDHPHCRHCGTALVVPQRRAYYVRRGFCGKRCLLAYKPPMRTIVCANTTCTRGDDGTRKVFATYRANAACCCQPCQNAHRRRERDLVAKRGLVATTHGLVDLPDHVIEQKLAALARRRKETRSWLRITDPWQQRSGSELHKQTTVETYSLEGAIL